MDANERLIVHHCWCGIEHAIPVNLHKAAKEAGQDVHCPLGHKWIYTKTEVQILKEKLGNVEMELSEANIESQRLERKVRKLEKPTPKKKKPGKA